MNDTLTIATKSKRVGHVASSIFAQIEGMLSLMGMFRVAIWYHHLSERQPMENRSKVAMVVKLNVVENNALSIIEANVKLEVLPIHYVSIQLKVNTLWLGDGDRLDWVPESSSRLDIFWIEIGMGDVLLDWSTDRRNINVDNAFLIGIKNGGEVEWVRILRSMDNWL